MNGYLDFDLMKKYPNKYNLTPKNIKTIKVLDWDRLKNDVYTWQNTAMNSPCWCHIEGCQKEGQKFDDESEFWIGFFEDGKIKCNFSCYGGMCSYNFTKFYSARSIENPYNMQVQVNAIKYLNMLIDEKIISLPTE